MAADAHDRRLARRRWRPDSAQRIGVVGLPAAAVSDREHPRAATEARPPASAPRGGTRGHGDFRRARRRRNDRRKDADLRARRHQCRRAPFRDRHGRQHDAGVADRAAGACSPRVPPPICGSKAARTTHARRPSSASRVRTCRCSPAWGRESRSSSSAPASSPRAAASCRCESSPRRGSIRCNSRPGAHYCASRQKYC